MSLSRRSAAGLTAIVLLAFAFTPCRGASDAAPPSTAVERIAYYKTRLDGPGSYPIHARLGLAWLERARETGRDADLREAERHLRRSWSWQPNYEALIGLASLAATRHRLDEAAAHAEAAALAVPGSVAARGILFEVALARGDVERATAIVESMLADGRSFASLARLAALHEYRGNLPGALEALGEACAGTGPEDTAAREAWCAVRQGALELAAHCDGAGAERAYARALARFPGYYLAREHLAELRAAQGRDDEARALYEELLAELPGPRYRLALAELQEAAGESRQARRARSRALGELRRSVEGGSPEHEREYVLALLDTGEASSTATALEVARRAFGERHDWLTADALGRACLAAGRAEEAGQLYADALRSGSRNPGLLLQAAHAARALGREDDARRLAAEALACPLALEPGSRAAAQ